MKTQWTPVHNEPPRTPGNKKKSAHLPPALGRQHDAMLDEPVLVDVADDVAAGQTGAPAQLERMELPERLPADGRQPDALGYVDRAAQSLNVLQRPLNAVEDAAEEAGRQFHGQRAPGALDRVAHGQAARVLVDLDRISSHEFWQSPRLSDALRGNRLLLKKAQSEPSSPFGEELNLLFKSSDVTK